MLALCFWIWFELTQTASLLPALVSLKHLGVQGRLSDVIGAQVWDLWIEGSVWADPRCLCLLRVNFTKTHSLLAVYVMWCCVMLCVWFAEPLSFSGFITRLLHAALPFGYSGPCHQVWIRLPKSHANQNKMPPHPTPISLDGGQKLHYFQGWQVIESHPGGLVWWSSPVFPVCRALWRRKLKMWRRMSEPQIRNPTRPTSWHPVNVNRRSSDARVASDANLTMGIHVELTRIMALHNNNAASQRGRVTQALV